MRLGARYLGWGDSTRDRVVLLAGHIGIGVFVVSAFALESAGEGFWYWYAVGTSLLLYFGALSIGYRSERPAYQSSTRSR